MEEYIKIYPELKEADGNNLRLHQIAKHLFDLERELNQNEKNIKEVTY